jgi:hypothetical protein
MPTVGGKANKVPKSLLGVTGKRSLVDGIEDGLVPVETEEGTDIDRNPEEDSEGNGPTERLARRGVQDKTNVLKT